MLSPADELWGDKGLVVSVKDEVLAYLEDIYRYVKRATGVQARRFGAVD